MYMLSNFAALCFIFYSTGSFAWTNIGGNSNGALFINSSNIERDKNYVRVWVAVKYTEKLITGTVRQETLREYDCKKQTSKTLKMNAYDEKGRLTEQINYRFNFHTSPKSNTPEDQVMKLVCGKT